MFKRQAVPAAFVCPTVSRQLASHLVRVSSAATPAAGGPAGQQALVLVIRRELRRRVREDAQQLRHVALPEGQQALVPEVQQLTSVMMELHRYEWHPVQ